MPALSRMLHPDPNPQIARWAKDTPNNQDHGGNVYWVGFATKQGVRDLKPGQRLFTGMLVGHYGNNLAEFEEAIRQAHDNGASGATFFTADSLGDSHLAIIKNYNKAFNR
jgi:hypothetical protein